MGRKRSAQPFRIPPESVPCYEKCMGRLTRYAEESAPEAFKWVGWASVFALLRVVAVRADAPYLNVLIGVLAFLVVGRIQWFLKAFPPKSELMPDGSLEIRYRRFVLMLTVLVAWGITLFLLIFVADKIADSDLLTSIR